MKVQYFENANNFISREDMDWCSEYCRYHWNEEVGHILRIADDAAAGRFLFDLRWDMERTYEPVVFEGEIQWDYMPKDDPEFIFQFNRHQFFICLGQAYAMTGDEKYAKTYADLLHSWIIQNPLNEDTKKTTWRSIEAGIRAETWVKSMSYFKDSVKVTDELVQEYVDSLKTHAGYLLESYKDFQIKSNWGVIESRGLMEIALALPKSDLSQKYLDTALERLLEEIQVQILDDGVQWEQSPMYHNEVFHCYLEALRLAKRYGLRLPAAMTDGIRGMAYANLAWKKPNHCQVMQGDSDETDIRDLLSQSAALLEDPVLKFGGYDCLDYDGAWDLLKEGVQIYDNLKSREPEFLNRLLEDSGNYYFRSDWSRNADFMHFRCGFLGGGHGHSDKLHIDLVINGEDILMDGGRYHYVEGEKRSWFKSALSHNVPVIDNQDYLICKDAWGVDNKSSAYFSRCKQKNGYMFLQGGHAGYINGGLGNVWINRKVIGLENRLFVIADEFYTTEEHTFTQLFHFNNQGKVSVSGNQATYTGHKADLDMVFLGEDVQLELKKSMLSRNYNQLEENQMAAASCERSGFCSMITVLSGCESGEKDRITVEKLPVTVPAKGLKLDSEEAEAVMISNHNKKYLVMIAHKDIADSCDMIEAGGCKGLGSVIVFDTETQRVGGTVLNW